MGLSQVQIVRHSVRTRKWETDQKPVIYARPISKGTWENLEIVTYNTKRQLLNKFLYRILTFQ